MPPKKKGNKNAQDDWEAELGETIAPAADAPQDGANEEEEESGGAGGLMAMLRKNKEKRKKKGLPEEDFVQGEDPSGAIDLDSKAPVEATMDDEEISRPVKKGKGGKQVKGAAAASKDADEETGEGGRILTKAEKEKLKKEREKQRKKEQV